MKNLKTNILIILLLVSIFSIQAQDYLIDFSIVNSDSKPDSVEVFNLTQNTKTALAGTDVLNLIKSISEVNTITSSVNYIKVYPNPASSLTNVEVYSDYQDIVNVSVYNLEGKEVMFSKIHFKQGSNIIQMSGFDYGTYILRLSSKNINYSTKILFNGKTTNSNNLKLVTNISSNNTISSKHLKSSSLIYSNIEMEYNSGDSIKFIGFYKEFESCIKTILLESQTLCFNFLPNSDFIANITSITEQDTVRFTDLSMNVSNSWFWEFGDNYTSTLQNPSHIYTDKGIFTISLIVKNDFGSDTITKTNYLSVMEKNNIVFNPDYSYGTLSDIDGNIYKTIQIGNQIWMAQNLATTTYNDGNPIPQVTDASEWISLSTAAYCWYENNKDLYKADYGALYNWYVVETEKLCPTGWHVATHDDWNTLINTVTYMDSPPTTLCAHRLKEAGYAHWDSSGCFSNNLSGFTALPAGDRFYYNGNFRVLGTITAWWCGDLHPNGVDAYERMIRYQSNEVCSYGDYLGCGRSVRCIKDE